MYLNSKTARGEGGALFIRHGCMNWSIRCQSLLLIFGILISDNVYAQLPQYTLFAVDTSLGHQNKQAAFEIVKQTTVSAQQSQLVGLTLFDDTVKNHIAPSRLDIDQIRALNLAMVEAPVSELATSNFAVGIERAIDAFSPEGGANLVVFSKGVIDTETDDPRARFYEWLNQVLLPQAANNNIAITLVIPADLPPHPQIEQTFAAEDKHRILIAESGAPIAAELQMLLNIPDGIYGDGALTGIYDAEVVSTVENEAMDTPIKTTIGPIKEEISIVPILRWVMLVVFSILLVGILILRYRTQRAISASEQASKSSSTYLPLTHKPNDTMRAFMDKDTDLPEKSESRKARVKRQN